MKAVVRLESEILAERARVLADPRPASYFALFKCVQFLACWRCRGRSSDSGWMGVDSAACRHASLTACGMA